MGKMNANNCLTEEATLHLAVSLLKDGDREWRHARDIHGMIEMDLENLGLVLPVDVDRFETLLKNDQRFTALGHGFFSLEGVEVDMDYFNRLISMGMYG